MNSPADVCPISIASYCMFLFSVAVLYTVSPSCSVHCLATKFGSAAGGEPLPQRPSTEKGFSWPGRHRCQPDCCLQGNVIKCAARKSSFNESKWKSSRLRTGSFDEHGSRKVYATNVKRTHSFCSTSDLHNLINSIHCNAIPNGTRNLE